MSSQSSPDTKSVMERHFALKAPCENCPFRVQGAIELEPGRLEGIIKGLVEDDQSTFHCHKTVHSNATGGDWDDYGNYVASGKEAMCAGAMMYLEKLGRPTVGMRIGRILGSYDPSKLEKHHDHVIDAA
jgi:hypothetical protein